MSDEQFKQHMIKLSAIHNEVQALFITILTVFAVLALFIILK